MAGSETVVGILDIGTLSLRFDVFKLDLSDPKSLASFRLIHRAGEQDMGSAEDVELLVRRFRETFDKVVAIAKEHGASRIIGGATGFFRTHTKFSDLVLAEAKQRSIELVILSGEEESKLIAEAMIRFFPHLPQSALLVDIGGGSTEVSIVSGRKLYRNTSVPMGVLVAKKLFPADSEGRFSAAALDGLEDLLLNQFSAVSAQFAVGSEFAPQIVIGSSGSARELERVLNPEGGVLLLSRLEEFFGRVRGLSLAELMEIEELDKKRIDLLIPGTAIFIAAMKAFGLFEARVSHFSLRHGILAAEAERNQLI